VTVDSCALEIVLRTYLLRTYLLTWRHGVVVTVVRRMNEVTLHRARLVMGWVTVFGYVTSQLGQLSLVSLWDANRVPASAGGKGWNVTSAGW